MSRLEFQAQNGVARYSDVGLINSSLFSFLEELYHTKEYDMVLTYKLYEQIAINFNKLTLNYMVSCRMKNSKN